MRGKDASALAPAAICRKVLRGSFMTLPDELECLAQVQMESANQIWTDCSPAEDRIAAFDFGKRRYVPRAALRQRYTNSLFPRRGAMSAFGSAPRRRESSVEEDSRARDGPGACHQHSLPSSAGAKGRGQPAADNAPPGVVAVIRPPLVAPVVAVIRPPVEAGLRAQCVVAVVGRIAIAVIRPVSIAYIAHALGQREIARRSRVIAHGHRRCWRGHDAAQGSAGDQTAG